MCLSFDEPAAMTPDQRRREIAAILARGIRDLAAGTAQATAIRT